jgi:chromosome partitioning protein
MLSLIFTNEKGGVAKTTTAIHVAAGLAIRGQKVLVIDADPQGHATISLGREKGPQFHDLIIRQMGWTESMQKVEPEIYEGPNNSSRGALYVVPSNIETRAIAGETDDSFAIKDRLTQLEGIIDTVVIDTSPTPSQLHGMLYLASDAVLYPTVCESLAFDGMLEAIKHRQQSGQTRARYGMKPLEIIGIIPTLYGPIPTLLSPDATC